jgi:hypothetical protein
VSITIFFKITDIIVYMARVTLNQVKTKFESGDRPSQADYLDLIDTLVQQATDLGTSGNNENTVNGIENITTVDSYDATVWRFVKYMITISKAATNQFYATEISILFDGTNLNVTEYGTIDTNGDIGTISVSKSGDTVSLIVTPGAIKPVTVRFARMGLKA